MVEHGSSFLDAPVGPSAEAEEPGARDLWNRNLQALFILVDGLFPDKVIADNLKDKMAIFTISDAKTDGAFFQMSRDEVLYRASEGSPSPQTSTEAKADIRDLDALLLRLEDGIAREKTIMETTLSKLRTTLMTA